MIRYEDLYHHGIIGMHWGIRRYQPYPKGHKGGKEVGEAAKSGKRSRTTKNKPTSQTSNHSERSAVSLNRNKNKMSDQELQAAVKRLNLERQLDNFSYEQRTSGLNRVDRAMRTVGKITIWATTGASAWNSIARIYNGISGKKRLPTI